MGSSIPNGKILQGLRLRSWWLEAFFSHRMRVQAQTAEVVLERIICTIEAPHTTLGASVCLYRLSVP